MPTDTSEKGLETRTINLLLKSSWLSGENRAFSFSQNSIKLLPV